MRRLGSFPRQTTSIPEQRGGRIAFLLLMNLSLTGSMEARNALQLRSAHIPHCPREREGKKGSQTSPARKIHPSSQTIAGQLWNTAVECELLSLKSLSMRGSPFKYWLVFRASHCATSLCLPALQLFFPAVPGSCRKCAGQSERAETCCQTWQGVHNPGREEGMGCHRHQVCSHNSFDSVRTLVELQEAQEMQS